MTIQLTDKNHFVFGYNQTSFSLRQSADDQWFVKYGRCQRWPKDFRSECIETAKTIRKNTSLPLFVLFSGGVDSEVVVRSFKEAQIPIVAAILKFNDDLNEHDISWARRTCNELNVEYRIFELDLMKFWDSGWKNYSEPTYCISPQLLPTMWLVDQVPGYAILGSGECLLIRTDAPDKKDPPRLSYPSAEWELYEKEKIAAWYRHFIVTQRDGCPGFFQYTPEIMLSYLRDPFVTQLCQNKIFGKYSTESSKLKIYQDHFPDIVTRPKYTGYEFVQDQDAKLRSHLVSLYPAAGQIIKTNYHALKEVLSPEFSSDKMISEIY